MINKKTREIKVINGIEKLKCSKCHYWLPFEDYSKDSATSTGRRAYCKICQKKYNKNRKKRPYNSGLIGLYLETCTYCKEKFTTESPVQTFCNRKCARRWYYEKNEQTETGKLYGRSKLILNIKKMKALQETNQ